MLPAYCWPTTERLSPYLLQAKTATWPPSSDCNVVWSSMNWCGMFQLHRSLSILNVSIHNVVRFLASGYDSHRKVLAELLSKAFATPKFQ